MSGPMHILTRDDDDAPNCGSGGGANTFFGLRVASIFIILVGSTFGALFPVLAKNSSWLHVPKFVFDFAKYFGSGVIIATAFIHLLSPALDALSSDCLADGWQAYVDAHGHEAGGHAAHGPEATANSTIEDQQHRVLDSAMTQIIGVAILEFGVTLHSVLIGLTLAVDPGFKVLFVVLIFHQTFEGLGVGSRLAYLDLPPKYRWAPYAGAALYGLTTPIGIAAGLGVRTTYNPDSTTASIVSGTLDALSSGILIYTGLVELAYALGCMLAGCGIMALLGKWA
ncbi:ZIP-like iron-zinc transporter [Armillaria borealis]|uniref:ZIP-like iron-zinc transporter n=1 Tax=Armillaria borealis TaxID=47425 RepID=A0AA39JQI2_9AGAR|nr:ZIP-like iron-zinc transporter [Armillaria borealis]